MESKSQSSKQKPSGVTTIGEVMAATLGGKSSSEKREKLIKAAENSESAVGVFSKLLRQYE